MKCAVVIDTWKLEIFERHLSQAGYSYEKGAGLTEETVHLYVRTDSKNALEVVVNAAAAEAAQARP